MSIADMLDQFENAPETNATLAPGFSKAEYAKLMERLMAVNKEDMGPLFAQEIDGVHYLFRDQTCEKLVAIAGPKVWEAIQKVQREEIIKKSIAAYRTPRLYEEDFTKIDIPRGPNRNEPFYRSLPKFRRRNR